MEKSTSNIMEKLTICVKFTKSILHSRQFTRKKTVAASRRNRKNMNMVRRNPIITPNKEIRMMEIPSEFMWCLPLFVKKNLTGDDGYD